MGYMLGIDLGTSAIKSGLVSLDGEVVATHSVPHSVSEPKSGWTEMNPDDWWRGVVEGVRGLCAAAGVSPAEIKSVGFSVLYPALVLLDERGVCLRPAILYSDQRAVRQSRWLREKIGENRLVRLTGNGAPTGTCSLTSLLWVKENEPEIFERARWFIHAEGYLAFRFTGEVGMDWTNASLTGLFETAGGMCWSEELCSIAGVPMEKLPRLHPSATAIGGVSREASDETGIPEGTPVAIGAGDTACSTFGAGLIESGETLLTCGTTDNLSTVVDEPKFDARNANCAHVAPRRWLFIATMTNTGQALDWFRRNFFPRERSFEEVFRHVAEAPAGSDGVLFLPYLHGERSPIWDPHARGVFHGLKLTTDRGCMLRALVEGVAFALRQNIGVMEELLGTEIERIIAVGGASRNRVWNEIKASVTGKPICPLKFQQTSLLGAALLGGVAAGIFADLKDALSKIKTLQVEETVSPDAGLKQRYNEVYAKYRALYPALREIFPSLSSVSRQGG